MNHFVHMYSVGQNSITRLYAQKATPLVPPLSELQKTFLQKNFPSLVKIKLSITFSNFLPLRPTVGS